MLYLVVIVDVLIGDEALAGGELILCSFGGFALVFFLFSNDCGWCGGRRL